MDIKKKKYEIVYYKNINSDVIKTTYTNSWLEFKFIKLTKQVLCYEIQTKTKQEVYYNDK